MTKASDNPMPHKPKAIVQERSLLVPLGQSKKLAAFANRSQPILAPENVNLAHNEILPGLKPEVVSELMNARKMIDDSIIRIMDSLPAGKKSSLFSLRFGTVESIKANNIKTAFRILGIDNKQVKMRLIAELDYYGNKRP
ncbi:MAG: hypothetical protein ACXW1W_19920 [Methylococcaceae bacterium]